MAYSGSFLPSNLQKYKGNFRKIKYRSSWELWFMKWLDRNPSVVKWNSEEAVIPYFCNAEGKKRRYFMDFWVQFEDGRQFFIEIKPKKETVPPVRPTKFTVAAKKRFINEMYTYSVNTDKWTAAMKLSESLGIQFRLVTEVSLRALGWRG